VRRPFDLSAFSNRRQGTLGKSKSGREDQAVRLRHPEGLDFCVSTNELVVVILRQRLIDYE
jgi:hypothetical protein